MQAKIKLLPKQIEFVQSTARHTGYIGGFGSGKTHAGIVKTILKKLELGGAVDVAYYLPTYPLIKQIAIPRFSEMLTQLGLVYVYNTTDKVFRVYNGSYWYGNIWLRSMDKPEYIVGYEVGYSLIDEADIIPKDKMSQTFKKILARNRAKKENNQLDMVSTPEGFKFVYDFFVKNNAHYKTLIKVKTNENPFLPKDYIQQLKDEYSEQELQAYLNGEFVNLKSGTVYNEFDRKRHHTDRQAKKDDILHIGIDFNVTNMSAVIHVIENGIFYAVDEIIKAYDTNDIINIIKQRYPTNRIAVYPDSAGKQRHTNATETDIDLLKRAGFVIRVRKKNPFVRDRVNEVNRLLRQDRYKVNTAQCLTLTQAFEQLSYDNNGQPDKSSGLDHITDAAGYFVYYFKKNTLFSGRVA